jgi:hypothetical protein
MHITYINFKLIMEHERGIVFLDPKSSLQLASLSSHHKIHESLKLIIL